MDFFEKVGETITTAGREAADKAKAVAEIAGLKGQIHTCDEIMQKNYREIGKLYYENFSQNPDKAFERHCKAIGNAVEAKKKLTAKLEEVKI